MGSCMRTPWIGRDTTRQQNLLGLIPRPDQITSTCRNWEVMQSRIQAKTNMVDQRDQSWVHAELISANRLTLKSPVKKLLFNFVKVNKSSI